jgi:hypothetical protein
VDIALMSAFVVLSLVSVRSVHGVQYGIKFKTNHLYYLRTVTNRTILQTVGTKPQKTVQNLEIGINIDVNDIDPNGIIVLDCNYVLAKVKQDSPFGKIDYDSTKKKPAKGAAHGYAALLGERFRIYMAPSGRIKQFSGLKQMQDSFGKKLPGGPVREQSVREVEPFIAEAITR